MGTELPRAALIDLVQGLSEYPARWDGEPEEQWGIWQTKPGVFSELAISAYSTTDTDEYRQDWDDTKKQLASTMSGLREFTLTIKVKSYELAVFPLDILERIRIRIGMVSGRFVLINAGLALVRMFPATLLPTERSQEDNRVAYVGAMDIRFAYAVSESAGDDDGTTIETVNGAYLPTLDLE